MEKDKHIEEMAKAIEQARIKALDTTNSMNYGFGGWYAKELYDNGYRKIYDDHERQCTCYALGCQMAEELEKKVAKKFIEAVDSMMECVCAMTGLTLTYYGEYAELKKKYESEKENVDANGL